LEILKKTRSLLLGLTFASLPFSAAFGLSDKELAYPSYQSGVKEEKASNHLNAVKNYLAAYETDHKNLPSVLKLGLMYQNNDAKDPLILKEAFQNSLKYLSIAEALDPKDPLPALLLGKAHQFLGNSNQAIKSYSKAINLEPENVLLKYNLAVLYFENKDFKNTIELLNKIILRYPDNLKARAYLGAALQSTDNYLAAIEQYNYILNYEKNYTVYKNLGDSWLALGQLEKAEESFQKVLQLDPNVPNVYVDLALVKFKKKDYQSAIENYKKALSLKNEAGWKRALAYALWSNQELEASLEEFKAIEEDNVVAYIYQILGKDEEACEYYQKALLKNPEDSKSRFNLANLYHNKKELDLAKNEYQKLLELRPNDIESVFMLGVIEQEQNHLDRAIAYYNEVLEQDTSNSQEVTEKIKQIKSNIFFNLGIAYKSQSKLSEAEEKFERIITQDIKNFEKTDSLYKELSFIKIALGKDSEAEKLLNDWLRDDPTNLEARNLYADFLVHNSQERLAVEQLRLASVLDATYETRLKLANLLNSQNNLYEALAEYQTILQNDPENINALLGAANNFKDLGLEDEAENIYKQAIEKHPEDLLANYNYGLLKQGRQKLKEAITLYEKVLEIDPDFLENYFVLGLVYWDLKEKEKAMGLWQKVLSKSGDEKLKSEIRKMIESSEESELSTG
jgi:tetratricopeptide (TPR) repeat protein